jgi:hypothetical protein
MSDWDEALKAPPIAEFERAVKDLRTIWIDLSTSLGRRGDVTVRVRTQWSALAADLAAFCEVFFEVLHETTEIWIGDVEESTRAPQPTPLDVDPETGLPSQDELRRWHDEWVASLGGEEGVRHYWEQHRYRMEVSGAASSRLAAAYKAMFFFVRAYQDASYRVLLQLLGDRNEGVSMSQAAKNPNNPVAEHLAKELPSYMPWFVAWRKLRDSVKAGRTHSLRGPQWNIGVSFEEVPPQDSQQSVYVTVRLNQIVEALDQSVGIARSALNLAIG